jgi:hypothetical protein
MSGLQESQGILRAGKHGFIERAGWLTDPQGIVTFVCTMGPFIRNCLQLSYYDLFYSTVRIDGFVESP